MDLGKWGVSAFIGLSVLAMAAIKLEAEQSLLLAPFGASLMLVLSAPNLPSSSMRAVVWGNIIAAVCGLIAGAAMSGAAALGVSAAAAFIIMTLARAQHPPALALCILLANSPEDWSFLLYPVLAGAVVVASIGETQRRLRAWHSRA